MSSLLDAASNIDPSDAPESSTTSRTKKNGKKAAPVWAHTRHPLDGEDVTLLYSAYCPLEDEDKLPYGSDTSSAMTKHIQRHHPALVIEKPLSKKQEGVK